MHKDKYWRSKIPVGLALLFVANLFLVIAIEVLAFYPHPAAITEKDFASVDSIYENCTIVDRDDRTQFQCYLVKTTDDQLHVIPVKVHGLIYSRATIIEKQITLVSPDIDSTEIIVKNGIHSVTVGVSREPFPGMEQEQHEMYLEIIYHGGGSASMVTSLYMVIAAILEALELALWQLLKGH